MISKEFIENATNLTEKFLDEYQIGGGEIALYGGGLASYWYVRWLLHHNIYPSYIIDNDPKKNGTVFEGIENGKKAEIPIISKEEMRQKKNYKDFKYIISAPKYKQEIAQDIERTFGDVKVYSFECEIYYTFIRDIPAYRKYLASHIEEIKELGDLLADDKSKETLNSIIMGRISAEQDYFRNVMVDDQYFPRDIIRLNENEVLVEAGGYDGKTLLDMVDKTNGTFKRIYCFEPDQKCIHTIEGRISNLNKPITLIEKGCGSKSTRLFFRSDSALGTSRVALKGEDYDYSIEITTLDEEIKEDISYLKIDIEGMELECLKGAEKILRRCLPKIAVCVYHNPEDLIEIPQYLQDINPNYKFYLRHHNWGATETVLYAV